MLKFLEVVFIFWAVVAPEVGAQLWSVAQKVDFLRQPKSFSLNFFAFLQAHAWPIWTY